MSDLKKAAQQALEALETVFMPHHPAVISLRAALEQPEQEPVAWMSPASESMIGKTDENGSAYHIITTSKKTANNSVPLYTHPPRREWRSLSDDELTALGIIHSRYQEESLETGGWFDFARAIEAALKERNA